MKQTKNKLFHLLSILGTHLMLIGLFWSALQYTIGMIPFIANIKIGEFPVFFFISLFIAIFIVRKLYIIRSPYKNNRDAIH